MGDCIYNVHAYLRCCFVCLFVCLFSVNVSRARLRPTGAAGAEYINASFVDVSSIIMFALLFAVPTTVHSCAVNSTCRDNCSVTIEHSMYVALPLLPGQ